MTTEPPNDDEILRAYVQAYPDLTLWRSARNNWKEMRDHLQARAELDGRAVPSAIKLPADWSDEIACRQIKDTSAVLWELGTLGTLYHRAQIIRPEGYDALGRLSVNEELGRAMSLSPEALSQIVDFERCCAQTGPLVAATKGKFRWASLPSGTIVDFLEMMPLDPVVSGKCDVAILVPCLETGGAQRVALWHYRAAEELGLSPVLVCTDRLDAEQTFAGENLAVFNLSMFLEEVMGPQSSKMDLNIKTLCLAAVLASLSPRVMHLVHAFVGYKLAEHRVLANLLRLKEKLLVSAFCPHMHKDGRVDGYFRSVPTIDSAVAAYVFDTATYRRELSELYGLEEARTAAVFYPVEKAAFPYPADSRQERAVLWASRLDYQKNPAIVFEIGLRLPHVSFHLYGGSVLSDNQIDWTKCPPNVVYKGFYSDFRDIPCEQYSLFLYTGRFDGMPNVVLEAGAAGMPVVAGAVGGIAEFIDRETGCLVADPTDVDAYANAIEDLLANPEKRREMGQRLNQKATAERSFQCFVRAVADLPVYRDIANSANKSSRNKPKHTRRIPKRQALRPRSRRSAPMKDH